MIPLERAGIYRFENSCIEDEHLALGDETMKIIVNTKGTVGKLF